jgi:hypothetical protein
MSEFRYDFVSRWALIGRDKSHGGKLRFLYQVSVNVISHCVPPKILPGFPHAWRAGAKTPRPGGGLRARWRDVDGKILEWDYQHGHVEMYDKWGKHIGAFDAYSGSRLSNAVKTRHIVP